MGMPAGYFAEGHWEGEEERKCEDAIEFHAELPTPGVELVLFSCKVGQAALPQN